MLSATALITWAPKCSESHFYKKSSKDIVPSPCFTTKATTIGFLRTVLETGDLSMDTEAKKLSSAASTEADAALGFLASEGTAAFTEIVEEKLVRKIDWTIVPLMWYKRNGKVYLSWRGPLLTFAKQPKRIGFWYLGTGTATIIGALVAHGLLFYTGGCFRSWQIMFLIFELITIAVGICFMIFLPDNPMASRLAHEEKLFAIESLRENRTGIENKHFKMYQFVEVFKDPPTYFIAVIVAAMNISNAAISSFSVLIIRSFGYTTKETELLTIPGGVVSVISIVTGTYLAGRFDQRCLSLIGILACGLLGGCLMAFSHEETKAAELAGNYLTTCVGAALPLMYSISGANVVGHTKKVTLNTIVLMSFCLGNILGPLTFRTEDEPDYMPAKIAIVATVSVAVVFSVLLKCYYMYENRRRDIQAEGHGPENSDFFGSDGQGESGRLRYSMF
ncbi:putative MFS transporter [Aspergillus fumigatus Af293]|uniref:MFS transporter, putative n=1 Tax=Aspergillus fumigatus (strain ATCC MYA-4609 / CBS 101355 / FGSC A1100 / Af293) TaxID=330879 RepID=Q4WHV4_ASPFU|nr:MFS transporter, putative [Aspergillus fumigatus Af293]EAL87501.1 MFS transporter, putative [Aspergillus fumigatus Af293]